MFGETGGFEIVQCGANVDSLLSLESYAQLVAELRARLLVAPHNLQDVEWLLKAQWRSGDLSGALASVERALSLNPYEPGYKYMRGVMRESVGMFKEAMADFSDAFAEAESNELRDAAKSAIDALEDYQIHLVGLLLAEDRMFRLKFLQDPEAALTERGFALTQPACRALLVVETNRVGLSPSAGVS
jgi:tetratricopeptide (TPR) repeat protein